MTRHPILHCSVLAAALWACGDSGAGGATISGRSLAPSGAPEVPEGAGVDLETALTGEGSARGEPVSPASDPPSARAWLAQRRWGLDKFR